jgi:hypothetical protein
MDLEDERRGLGAVDIGLICLLLFGLYTGLTLQLGAKLPVPSLPAGVAGLTLIARHRDRITSAGLASLLAVILLYLLSILSAQDLAFLPKRFTGFVQIVYSLVVGYGLFLALTQANRKQVADLFLCLCLLILVGTLLEDYGGLRSVSDKVRTLLYSSGVYEADVRDELLYGRIRPKLFASEPSAVTFAYTLYGFTWLVMSRWRWRLVLYLALVAVGTFAMPGPTLMLMLLLIAPYQFLVAVSSEADKSQKMARLAKMLCVAVVLGGLAAVMAFSIFSARLKEIGAGSDPSFFYRVTGPALAARAVVAERPLAGAGLTAEEAVEGVILNAYMRSRGFSPHWHPITDSKQYVINYFWLHWIYLGLGWGSVIFIALTFWLRNLAVPSIAFCWLVWSILGQASGAYVGPVTWSVLFLAAALAVLRQREPAALPASLDPARPLTRPLMFAPAHKLRRSMPG